MKKGLRTAACALIALSMLAGCSGKKTETITSGMANADLFDNMKKGETVDAKTVTEAFNTALESAEAADSATIDTNTAIELTENGKTTSTQNITQIKYKPADTSADSEAAADTEEQTATEENEVGTLGETDQTTPERIAYVSITNEYDGQSDTLDGYYENNCLYYELEGKKVKEAMDYDSFMYIVGSYALKFDEDVVESAYKTSSKNETEYTVKFNREAMAEMMMNNIAGTSSAMTEDEGMSIDSAFMYFAVDKDGCLKGFDLELEAKFVSTAEAEGEQESETAAAEETKEEAAEETTVAETDSTKESPFKYSIVANFSNLGSTQVDSPENLSEYRDVNEVLEEIQQEEDMAAEQETAEETITAE